MPKKIIGLLAGEDDLPLQIMQAVKKSDDEIVAVLFKECQYPKTWQKYPTQRFSLGQISAITHHFINHRITHLVMAGKLRRPLLKQIQLDLGARWFLLTNPKIFKKGDNSLLTAIAAFFQKRTKAILLSPHEILYPSAILTKFKVGLFAGKKPKKTIWKNIWQDFLQGKEILKTLSPFDIGQALIMADGLVLGIETIAGTAALIAAVKPHSKDRHAILIKDFKQQQHNKIDCPSLGVETIHQLKKSGVIGIFFPKNGNIIKPDSVKTQLEKNQIFLWLF